MTDQETEISSLTHCLEHHRTNNVPSDLIPVSRAQITLDYARDTKNWARTFNEERFKTLYDDNYSIQTLQEWHHYLMQLQSDLHSLGFRGTCDHITTLFATHYEFKNPNTNDLPNNFNDVLQILKSKTWYNQNKLVARNAVHMILYGIYRCNFDDWIHEIANKWKASKNINEFSATLHRKGTGFVYQNLIKTTSVNIQQKIRAIMWQNHHEEITTRRKSPNQQTNLIETEVQYNNCKAFLYTLKSHERIEDDKRTFQSSILNLLNSKVSLEEIQRIFNKTIQEHKKSNDTLTDEYECEFTCIYIFVFDDILSLC